MNRYSENNPCDAHCSTILPGSTDVCVKRSDCKVRADITVDRIRSVMIWGTVTDCIGMPVPNALVKLLRYTGECGCDMEEICRTHTDCQGYYQFDLEHGCEGRYRILASLCTTVDKECTPCEQYHNEKIYQPCHDCQQYSGKSCTCRSVVCNNIQYY